MREALFEFVDSLIGILSEQVSATVPERMELLIGSLFSAFDGTNSRSVGYMLIPAPHPTDREFDQRNGECWYPYSPIRPHDLAGMLYDEFTSSLRPRKRVPLAFLQASLAVDVYECVLRETESFEEQGIGADLAYLMGAILKDNLCEWPESCPLLQLLRQHYPPEHPIWRHVKIESGVRSIWHSSSVLPWPLWIPSFRTLTPC